MVRLGFFGAAGEVTGSCYLIDTGRARVMLDFGMHQGEREAYEHNHRMPDFDPGTLDAAVLTHGHLDHCGRLPLLADTQFRGKIFCTPATLELAQIILEDAANIQEADAERENRRFLAPGAKPVTPLYTKKDVVRILPKFSTFDYDKDREIAPGVTIRFVDAGHILGSSSVFVTVAGAGESGGPLRLVFSGDVGVIGSPLLRDPHTPFPADVVVLESTYGDRNHRPLAETRAEFLGVIQQCQREGGKILIPAFAIGRTQDLLYHIGSFLRSGQLARADVYVDSPMATDATQLYKRHIELYDCEARALLQKGINPLSFPGLKFVRTVEESRALNARRDGIIVIAASGMATGGRIVHHLRHSLERPETHVVIAGFQGHGTLGRKLVDRIPSVRIFGEEVTVRAQIHTLGGFSAHAGQSGLLDWAGPLVPTAKRWFLTHGEDGPRGILRDRLESLHGIRPILPRYGEFATL